jgi:hypothetical protein
MSGPVKLNGVMVYAFVTNGENDVGIRVSTDDWERLGLHPGQQVQIDGHEGMGFFLAAVDQAPPFVWLRLASLASRLAS